MPKRKRDGFSGPFSKTANQSNWSKLKSPIKGDDLLAQGWEPGPEIGIEINRQRMKLIDKLSNI